MLVNLSISLFIYPLFIPYLYANLDNSSMFANPYLLEKKIYDDN